MVRLCRGVCPYRVISVAIRCCCEVGYIREAVLSDRQCQRTVAQEPVKQMLGNCESSIESAHRMQLTDLLSR